jgi:hypothetical protein
VYNAPLVGMLLVLGFVKILLIVGRRANRLFSRRICQSLADCNPTASLVELGQFDHGDSRYGRPWGPRRLSPGATLFTSTRAVQ